MEETWKDCKHYEGLYEVSTIGRVKNKKTGKILKQCMESSGYYKVNLYKYGKVKNESVHRLVALTFIDNPDSKPQVNHIDGDKLNNEVTNLEWATQSENMKHAYDNGLHYISDYQKQRIRESNITKKSKAVRCIETNTIYLSANEAQRQTEISQGSISHCCNGVRNTAGGFHWEYVN